MKKIGILFWDEKRFGSQSHEMNKNLIYAVEEGGALPLGIPSVMEEREMEGYLDMLDGVILTGGSDIGPFLYKEDPIEELGQLNVRRDESEKLFVEKIFQRKTPALALCRGMQMANVVRGGTLYQDIPLQRKDSLVHFVDQDNKDFKTNYHFIDIEEDSHLFKSLGKNHIVNSYHHQAIKDLGEGLRVTSRARDGIIEGIESMDEDHFFIGVQFHPEFINESQGYVDLFEYFIGGI